MGMERIGKKGFMDEIKKELNEIMREMKLKKKEEKVGFEWYEEEKIIEKIEEEKEELKEEMEEREKEEIEEEYGEIILEMVNIGSNIEIDEEKEMI